MNKFNALWKTYSPIFHVIGWIVTLAFTAGVVWAGVGGYDERITKLEGSQTDTAVSIHRVENNLAYLMGRFKLDYKWNE